MVTVTPKEGTREECWHGDRFVWGREHRDKGLSLALLKSVSFFSHIQTRTGLHSLEELGVQLGRHDLLKTGGTETGCFVLLGKPCRRSARAAEEPLQLGLCPALSLHLQGAATLENTTPLLSRPSSKKLPDAPNWVKVPLLLPRLLFLLLWQC